MHVRSDKVRPDRSELLWGFLLAFSRYGSVIVMQDVKI
jgi:hypothetical protein